MFEAASRLKIRFDFRGLCTVEDLWDLPLTSLDSIYKKLNLQMKAQKEESLLEKKSQEDKILELKINIVKHIVETKIQEGKVKEDQILRKQQRQKIEEIISRKQDTALEGKSIEDLMKLADELK